MLKAAAKHLAALAGYALLSVVYTYPLIWRMGTHAFGAASADSRYWLWWLWQFRHAAASGANPFWSDMIYWPYGANLIFQHGLFYAAFGAALQPVAGLVASFNLSILQILILSGYGVFLIASEWGAEVRHAFIAGAFYAFSAYVTDHYMLQTTLDHTSTQTLPFFVWALSRLWRLRRLRDAALAALMLTWAWGCDYYHFLVCLLLLPLFYLMLDRPLSIQFERRASSAELRRGLDIGVGFAGAWVAYSVAWRGQIEFHGRGGVGDILRYVAPYLAFWAFLAVRLAASWTARISWRREALSWRAVSPYLGVIGCYALINLPLILALARIFALGDSPGGNARPWRGGGNPNDLALFLTPSPFHPVWGSLWGDWLRKVGTHHTWCPSLLVLGAAFWLWRQKLQDVWVRLWLAGAAFCFLLTLGPWLKVFGFNTYLPLPFYFMHLLPIYNHMQVGELLQPFTNLFLALLFAAALKEFSGRLSEKFRPWLAALAFLGIGFELAHTGIPNAPVEAPALLERAAELPEGVLLDVPFGAMFDGMGPHGDVGFGSIFANYRQMFHHKPMIGGANGRMPRYVYEQMSKDAFLAPLVAAQEGRGVHARLKDKRFVSKALRERQIRYVLVRAREIPPELAGLIPRWPVRLIDEDDGLRLYEVSR